MSQQNNLFVALSEVVNSIIYGFENCENEMFD
jgi:hypothetical protein